VHEEEINLDEKRVLTDYLG